MNTERRMFLLALLFGASFVACGGSISTLKAKGRATGEGPARLSVLNRSGAVVHALHLAPTQEVDRARASGAAPGTAQDAELWGDDLLDRGTLPVGEAMSVGSVRAGRYNLLARDGDSREQMVKAMRLEAGGKYVLELGGEGWRLPR